MTIKKYCISAVATCFAFILIGSAVSCSGSSDTSAVIKKVVWKASSTVGSNSVSAKNGSATLEITAPLGAEWRAEIVGDCGWCSFSFSDAAQYVQEGVVKDGLNLFYIYYAENSQALAREAEIKFEFKGDEPIIFTLKQSTKAHDEMPRFGVWAELPDYKESSNYDYATHFVTINERNTRNYSLCFDQTKRVALWVAYPHIRSYEGSIGRNDKWIFDPKIASEYQANLGRGSYNGNWDRGHQLPNADRNGVVEMQQQTFHNSNATPQWNRLNQGLWAKLEKKVRDNVCSDTLYVVTGCHYDDVYETTTDKSGNACPIPSHYYKILLRTVSGNSGNSIAQAESTELKAIGFWVSHEDYQNETLRSISIPVREIEKLTGFTFFSQVDESVKLQNSPGDWGVN